MKKFSWIIFALNIYRASARKTSFSIEVNQVDFDFDSFRKLYRLLPMCRQSIKNTYLNNKIRRQSIKNKIRPHISQHFWQEKFNSEFHPSNFIPRFNPDKNKNPISKISKISKISFIILKKQKIIFTIDQLLLYCTFKFLL